jgi:hypothetical protein
MGMMDMRGKCGKHNFIHSPRKEIKIGKSHEYSKLENCKIDIFFLQICQRYQIFHSI